MGSKNTNQGRYALITGATSGFGYEFAKIFANNVLILCSWSRNDDKLAEISADFGQSHEEHIHTKE